MIVLKRGTNGYSLDRLLRIEFLEGTSTHEPRVRLIFQTDHGHEPVDLTEREAAEIVGPSKPIQVVEIGQS